MVTAAKTNDLQMRPLMYRLLPEPPLRTEQFLTDNDNLDDEEVVKKKIKDLFGGLIPEKLIVFVHGYNTKAEGALQAAQTLSEATGLHVLAFDWASEHDLGFLPVKYKSLHSGLVTGYMKDTEEAVASVEALNWLLFIILRGIKQERQQQNKRWKLEEPEKPRQWNKRQKQNERKRQHGRGLQPNTLTSEEETMEITEGETAEVREEAAEVRSEQDKAMRVQEEQEDLQVYMRGYKKLLAGLSNQENRRTTRSGEPLRVSQNSPEPFFSQYRTMLSHLKCVIFKQADCHIVTMKRFLQKDLPTLNEEGDTVHIAVYSHNEDKALGFSQLLHHNIHRVGQLDGLKAISDGLEDRHARNFHPIDATVCATSSWLRKKLPWVTSHSYFNHPEFKASIKRVLEATNSTNGALSINKCAETKPRANGEFYKLDVENTSTSSTS
eukprot:CAMPEP_0206136614 /NCGR_PEP_ID=MMETSP1473-20131121/1855_1 /ASSEMBLY_ACC=CAM_ASM_001109 /TAXON_ID=1461547 /ORGANISM="Stichococcus sp, Strain RCC1054" /LENGTH=437 /DNA_ID=CAMNT_0053529287 /DNA_START=317 /DNA_END=1630 /DNA_ORIENTATION=+